MSTNKNSRMIDPKSMTYEAILNDLFNYVQSLPDSKRWLDYFKFSEGATLMELMAGIGSFLRYNSLVTWRESSILTARLRSTIYGMADLFGYPPNREQSAKLTITFTSDYDIWWDRLSPLGTIGSADISLLESTQIRRGSNTVTVVLGRWISRTKISDTARPFTAFNWDVSSEEDESGITNIDSIDNNNVNIYVDSSKVSWTRYVEELGSGSDVQLRTLASQLSVIFGSDDLGLNVQNGQEIKLQYVAVDKSNIDTNTYVPDQVTLHIEKSQTVSVETISPYYAADSLEKLVRLIPGYYAAQRRMVNRADHEAILSSYTGMASSKWVLGTCVDSTGKTLPQYRNERTCVGAGGSWTNTTEQCCTATMAYLFEDEHVVTPLEQEQIFTYLDDFIMPGESIVLIHPTPVQVHSKFTIVVEEGTDTRLLQMRVYASIDLYCKKLGLSFKIEELARTIRELDGVIYLYTHQPNDDIVLSESQYLIRGTTSIDFTTDASLVQYLGSVSSGAGYVIKRS
ncbi:putative baseplate wedge subunit protein [Vibrio phage 150E35-1]|nr:putative baseplate wedge subunit protein [Vibrio phage 150E35-1]